MQVHVMDLEHGDLVATDVFNSYGLLVLSADTTLDSEAISKLFQHGIDYVDIEPRSKLNAVKSSARQRLLDDMVETFQNTVGSTESFFAEVAASGAIDESKVEEHFFPLAENFRRNPDVTSLLLLVNDKNTYTYHHSLQVGMLSYYLAKWMGKNEDYCLLAGKAGYLHDIGKCKIPTEILDKPGRLTPDEFELVKRHTLFGFDLINESIGDPNLSLPALQHHERYDGRGYPYGITEDEIHPLSKIVAIADIYSAMVSRRVYQMEKDLLNVLHELYRLSFSQVDPYITQVFIRNLLPNMIGRAVLLNTGKTGKIVLTNPTDAFRPLIQVEDGFVDLAQTNQIFIDKIVSA